MQHAENGLPVMISEAIIVVSLYSWIKNGTDPIVALSLASVIFFLSAWAGMQEHRIECAHFKTDVSRAQEILRKFNNM